MDQINGFFCEISKKADELVSLFTDHPEAANQTYFEHLKHAWYFSYQAKKAGAMFFLHGLFPFWFEFSGSDLIKNLNDELQAKRNSISFDNDKLTESGSSSSDESSDLSTGSSSSDDSSEN